MRVLVNGEEMSLPEGATITQLLQILKLENTMVAVEVSGEIITKSEQSSYVVQVADTIEIIKAVGGG